tara:strand:+ start:12716 stop:13672 length:957 start_codon:yes stop_codon:yes gene_type:complete
MSPVAGDASSRSYFRAHIGGRKYVLAHAPPATEKNAAFVAVRELLADAGVRVPAVLAVDYDRGYLLLEDLGEQLLLPALSAATADDFYRLAFDILRKLATADIRNGTLPPYDDALLREEFGRFDTWFVQALLEYRPGADAVSACAGLCDVLVEAALEQPRVLVHRDFHSRNLMLTGDGALAVIDFQDAVAGPLTYDLVSLLRDCYIRWPGEQVRQWALAYRGLLLRASVAEVPDEARFLRWFDLMGLQRHIKVLGTFARLALRDGKSAYLNDLPLVLAYVEEILARYAASEPAIARFRDWYTADILPLVEAQAWSRRG